MTHLDRFPVRLDIERPGDGGAGVVAQRLAARPGLTGVPPVGHPRLRPDLPAHPPTERAAAVERQRAGDHPRPHASHLFVIAAGAIGMKPVAHQRLRAEADGMLLGDTQPQVPVFRGADRRFEAA